MKKLFYGVCLAILLSSNAGAVNPRTVETCELVKSSSSWNGECLPVYEKGQPEITILRIKIPPGQQLQIHKHSVINAGVLLQGELTVFTEDNKRLHLNAGDPIVEVVNTWHYGKNEGNVPAEILVFYAGIHGKPITIKK